MQIKPQFKAHSQLINRGWGRLENQLYMQLADQLARGQILGHLYDQLWDQINKGLNFEKDLKCK